jgi:hypothetical protein
MVMGNFRIEIDAVGGHGCQREVKDGGTVAESCGLAACPDCIARKFVAELKAAGVFNYPPASAKLTHWPGTPGEVRDDLLTGIRSGSF